MLSAAPERPRDRDGDTVPSRSPSTSWHVRSGVATGRPDGKTAMRRGDADDRRGVRDARHRPSPHRVPVARAPPPRAVTARPQRRVVVEWLADVVARRRGHTTRVVIGGATAETRAAWADDLAEGVMARGRVCRREGGLRPGGDVVLLVGTEAARRPPLGDPDVLEVLLWEARVEPTGCGADVVIGHDDQGAPTVIADRRAAPPDPGGRIAKAQRFFAPRAAGWNERFPEDAAGFTRAISEMRLARGDAVLDIGCGAGRALPGLRSAVGDDGLLVGVDVTVEMLASAGAAASPAFLVAADAWRLPVRDASFDALFAAGLVGHLPDTVSGFVEFARVARPEARLCIFHPVGRERLAAKHDRVLSDDDPLDPGVLPTLLAATRWSLVDVDDTADRFFALAVRT